MFYTRRLFTLVFLASLGVASVASYKPFSVYADGSAEYACPYPSTQEERQIRCQYITATLSVLEGWQTNLQNGSSVHNSDSDNLFALVEGWEPIASDCLTSYRSHDSRYQWQCARNEMLDSGCFGPASHFTRMMKQYPEALQDCQEEDSNQQECLERIDRYYSEGLATIGWKLQESVVRRLASLKDEYVRTCGGEMNVCPEDQDDEWYGNGRRGRNSYRYHRYRSCADVYRNGRVRGVFGSNPECYAAEWCATPTPEPGEEDCYGRWCRDDDDDHCEEAEGTPTPDGTTTPIETPTPDGTTTPNTTPTPDGTVTPGGTVTPDGTATPDGTPGDGTPTPSGTGTPGVTNTPSGTGTPTPVRTATGTPIRTGTTTPVGTGTATPVRTGTNVPTTTATTVQSATPSVTRTVVPTGTSTVAFTPSLTPTGTIPPTGTATRTVSPSITPSLTATRTVTVTVTVIPTLSPSTTPTVTISASATPTSTSVAATPTPNRTLVLGVPFQRRPVSIRKYS